MPPMDENSKLRPSFLVYLLHINLSTLSKKNDKELPKSSVFSYFKLLRKVVTIIYIYEKII